MAQRRREIVNKIASAERRREARVREINGLRDHEATLRRQQSGLDQQFNHRQYQKLTEQIRDINEHCVTLTTRIGLIDADIVRLRAELEAFDEARRR